MESLVRSLTGEEWRRRESDPSDVKRVTKMDVQDVGVEDRQLQRCLAGEARSAESVLEIGGECVPDRCMGSAAVGEKSREAQRQSTVLEPLIEPKRGGRAISQLHRRERTEPREFFVDDAAEKGGRTSISEVAGIVAPEPIFPREVVRAEELVDKFHQQAVVLVQEIFHPQPASDLGHTDVFPGDQALGTVTLVFPSPNESPAFTVKNISDVLGQMKREHVVDREATQNRIYQDHPAARAQKL